MEENAKKKSLSVKGLLKALLVVLLILFVISLIIILGGKKNKHDSTIIQGESGTNSLVVYFSQGDVVDLDKTDAVSSASLKSDDNGNVYGNTEYVARLFQQATGADLYSIQTNRLYYKSYPLTAYRAFWEEKFNTRPKLIGLPENLDQYDTIYVGFPIWWFNAPMPIGSFFEEYDVSGKTIIPFCTNQGSGVDSGYELLREECSGATVKEGFNGNNTDLKEVTDWLKGQGYITEE